MSKRKQPEFKRYFYLSWFAQDWLGDPGLKMCDPEFKAVWMDMLMNMVLTFPFGHMSRLSKSLMKKSELPLVKKILLGSLVHQNPDQKPNQTSHQDPNQDDDQWVRLSVGLRLPEQFSLVENIEDQIPKLTGYDSVLVRDALQALDELNVFSRTESGIIYSRRMKKDFEKRKTAFVNACGGVNPYEYKSLKRNSPKGLLHQNPDQTTDQTGNQNGQQTDNQTADQNPGPPPHQTLSNSNSNSNSNNKDILTTVGNPSTIGNQGDEKTKKNDDDGRSGSENGTHDATINGSKKVDFTILGKYKDQILNDNSFLEPFMMAVGTIPKESLEAWLNVFNLHLVVERKLNKDYADYLSHFRNWWYKGDRTKKPPTLQEIKAVSKSTQQSKTLLDKYDTVL
jgi:hypothetical protein